VNRCQYCEVLTLQSAGHPPTFYSTKGRDQSVIYPPCCFDCAMKGLWIPIPVAECSTALRKAARCADVQSLKCIDVEAAARYIRFKRAN